MKYFCLPSDFQFATLDTYSEMNLAYCDAKIAETYGQMAPDALSGSCQSSGSLPPIDRPGLEKYIEYGLSRGLEFNYVLNTACMENDELTKEGYRVVRDFLRMLRDIGVSSVTMALPSLMEIALYAAPELRIKASAICQINSPLKAKFYDNLGIKRIMLDEDIIRRFDVLRNIRKAYTGEMEITVNSFCCMDCPYRMFDYNSLSHIHTMKKNYPYFSTRCRNLHMGAENFIRMNWIRPEDLHHYYESGITWFKLQGRSNAHTGKPAKAVRSYIEGSYEGDLVELLELFSTRRSLAIADCSVDNRSLDGFLEFFVQSPEACTRLCEECRYCKSWAEAAISSTDRHILDLMKIIDTSLLDEYPLKLESRVNA